MSEPITQKTLLETAIEKRNQYQGRYIENMVNIYYYTKQKATFKNNTKEKVEAIANLKNAERASGEDQMLMDSFDELIKTLEKAK